MTWRHKARCIYISNSIQIDMRECSFGAHISNVTGILKTVQRRTICSSLWPTVLSFTETLPVLVFDFFFNLKPSNLVIVKDGGRGSREQVVQICPHWSAVHSRYGWDRANLIKVLEDIRVLLAKPSQQNWKIRNWSNFYVHSTAAGA